MKKLAKLFLIFLGILYFIYFILANLDIFRVYTNPTTANEPTIKVGSRMFVSNLKKPEKNDFVCFYNEDKFFGKIRCVFRLCAIENDTIEIKNGIVYVNHKNIDISLNLMHSYKIEKQIYQKLVKSKDIENHNFTSGYLKDSIIVNLSDKKATELQLTRLISKNKNYLDNFITQKWTKDNFGPYVIPKNKLFVLGDNRDGALDSRYINLVAKKDIIGVVYKIFN